MRTSMPTGHKAGFRPARGGTASPRPIATGDQRTATARPDRSPKPAPSSTARPGRASPRASSTSTAWTEREGERVVFNAFRAEQREGMQIERGAQVGAGARGVRMESRCGDRAGRTSGAVQRPRRLPARTPADRSIWRVRSGHRSSAAGRFGSPVRPSRPISGSPTTERPSRAVARYRAGRVAAPDAKGRSRPGADARSMARARPRSLPSTGSAPPSTGIASPRSWGRRGRGSRR